MLSYVSIAIQLLGLIGLLTAYRSSRLKLMFASAILLWFGATVDDFARGVIAGFSSAQAAGAL